MARSRAAVPPAVLEAIPQPGWFHWHGRRFLLAVAITASIVVAAGWLTGLRDVMHGALLAVAVAALLPLVIIGAGLVIILGTIVIAAVAAAFADVAIDPSPPIEGGIAIAEGGARLAPRYYRFLARQRHPVFWGIGAGTLLGGLILWAVLAIAVLPGEARSTESLADAQHAVELHYAQHHAYPRPDGGHLIVDGAIAEDGFGNPLEYRVRGGWRVASWTLRSFGYDGERGTADDLCVSGESPLVGRVIEAAKLAKLSKHARSLGERLESVAAMRCE
jgi:hypothetical protein